MQPTKIHNAQTQLDVSESVIDGSKFLRVMLKDCLFEDVMMAGARIKDANLTDLEIYGAQLGGAYIHNIGMPPKGHPFYDPNAKMRPLKFEDCNLEGSTIEDCNLAGSTIEDCNLSSGVINNCDLSGVELTNCNIKGLKLDGVDLSVLMDEYRKSAQK
jgi:uncharacterized protein YjbI with pentapeptide repeats